MRNSTSFACLRHVWLAALAIWFSSACSTIDPCEKNRELLVSAANNLETGKSQAAAADAERLFAGRADEADQFPLQRYYALFLLAQAHAQAAISQPFLRVPGAPGDSGRSEIGSPRNKDIGHLVAATYYAALAADLAQAAAKQSADAARLLPPGLALISAEDVLLKLKLIRLVALSRVGFDTTFQRDLENLPALQLPETCDEVIARVDLQPQLRPWVYYTLFQFLKDGDAGIAYAFGARARVEAEKAKGSIPADRLTEIVEWIKAKAAKDKLFFCCKTCGEAFEVDMLRCARDPTPITSVVAKLKGD